MRTNVIWKCTEVDFNGTPLGKAKYLRGCGYWQRVTTKKVGSSNWQESCKHCGKRQRLGKKHQFYVFRSKEEADEKAIEMNTFEKFTEIKGGKCRKWIARNTSDNETSMSGTLRSKGSTNLIGVPTPPKTEESSVLRNIEMELESKKKIEEIRNGTFDDSNELKRFNEENSRDYKGDWF